MKDNSSSATRRVSRRGAAHFAERFWSKVDRSGGRFACWEWRGGRSKGYGTTFHEGRVRGTHRVAWELLRGPIPPGLVLDHVCENKACVNPLHLDPVTHALNSSRGQGYLLVPKDLKLPACKAEAACLFTLIARRAGGDDEFEPIEPCGCDACAAERAS